jgi:hypothetical protein
VATTKRYRLSYSIPDHLGRSSGKEGPLLLLLRQVLINGIIGMWATAKPKWQSSPFQNYWSVSDIDFSPRLYDLVAVQRNLRNIHIVVNGKFFLSPRTAPSALSCAHRRRARWVQLQDNGLFHLSHRNYLIRNLSASRSPLHMPTDECLVVQNVVELNSEATPEVSPCGLSKRVPAKAVISEFPKRPTRQVAAPHADIRD